MLPTPLKKRGPGARQSPPIAFRERWSPRPPLGTFLLSSPKTHHRSSGSCKTRRSYCCENFISNFVKETTSLMRSVVLSDQRAVDSTPHLPYSYPLRSGWLPTAKRRQRLGVPATKVGRRSRMLACVALHCADGRFHGCYIWRSCDL